MNFINLNNEKCLKKVISQNKTKSSKKTKYFNAEKWCIIFWSEYIIQKLQGMLQCKKVDGSAKTIKI